MKTCTKWLVCLMVVLVLLSGCKKTQEEFDVDVIAPGTSSIIEDPMQEEESLPQEPSEEQVEETVPEDTPEIPEETPETEPPTTEETAPKDPELQTFDDVSALLATLEGTDYIVFRGAREQDVSWSGGEIISSISVYEVFYGDVAVGDTVEIKEFSSIRTSGDDLTVYYNVVGIEPTREGLEYVFIMKIRERNGTVIAADHAYMRHANTKISKREEYAQKVADGTATDLEKYRLSVLEKYLPNP